MNYENVWKEAQEQGHCELVEFWFKEKRETNMSAKQCGWCGYHV